MNFLTSNFSNPNDAVIFANVRNNAKQCREIIKENKGLSNLDEIAQSLSSGHYIPVLKAIWSEPNKYGCLLWLREQTSKHLHALLLYELAIAEFATSPTEKTLNLTSIPLMKAAGFRVEQDEKCINDPSLKNCSAFLNVVYSNSLEKLVQKELKKSLSFFLFKEKKRTHAIYIKMTKIVEDSLTIQLPAPDWIAYHGIKMIRCATFEVKSAKKCSQIRRRYAQNILKIIASEKKVIL